MTPSIFFALIAFGSGLTAAWYWHASTKANVAPVWEDKKDGDKVFHAMRWIESVSMVFATSSRLNKKAALWTAASVLSSAISAIAGAWPTSN